MFQRYSMFNMVQFHPITQNVIEGGLPSDDLKYNKISKIIDICRTIWQGMLKVHNTNGDPHPTACKAAH